MKPQIRLVGIDDAAFKKGDVEVRIIATFFRGGDFLDGVMSCTVTPDGNDATERITQMILKSKFRTQIKCILLDGIAVGGFNVIDIRELHQKTRIPVLVVVRIMPDIETIKRTLEKIGMKEKIVLIEKAGAVQKMKKVYVQLAGLREEDALKILEISCTRSFIPEPVRVAHLIAQGISLGESKGGA